MHSLEQLRRGELAGISRLDLSADLDTFPPEIFDLADSLEVLNLSGNRLRTLPHDLSRLHKLKVLFCSDNPFEILPETLGDCPQLEMVGFKSNQLREIPAAALPSKLRWLILTDNHIENLPSELGERARLQKLMLAGNRLTALPESLAGLDRLELLRIAANRLETLPDWLLQLPSLAWLAFAGNPGSDRAEAAALAGHPQAPIALDQLVLGNLLGQGASGLIHRARWNAREVAVKLFKGQMTSDGLPHSEMAACLSAGAHPQLLPVIGPLRPQAGQPDGLLLELLEPRFRVLAGPPSLASCTRDCYAAQEHFSTDQVLTLARGVASALAHLHGRGILHGDLYAHNLLVDGHDCRLSDFGAASFFTPGSAQGAPLQRLESRAFLRHPARGTATALQHATCGAARARRRLPAGRYHSAPGLHRDTCSTEMSKPAPARLLLRHHAKAMPLPDSRQSAHAASMKVARTSGPLPLRRISSADSAYSLLGRISSSRTVIASPIARKSVPRRRESACGAK